MSFELTVQKGERKVQVAVTPATTVDEFKAKVSKAVRISVERLALSIPNPASAPKVDDAAAKGAKPGKGGKPKDNVVRLSRGKSTLADYKVAASDVVVAKDLGPQIGYRTVFVVEYAGPIAIMLMYALRPELIYGPKAAGAPWNPVAYAALIAWILHFVKRELETFFVHKFSRPTMPLSNLFKNSVYYWGFAAAVGYPLCHPAYTAPSSMEQVYVGFALMLVSELVNLAVHLQLSSMRPAEGADDRRAPGGILFSLVSCPNYTAEVLSWVGFSIATQVALSFVFTVVGLAQMTQWALEKHVRYLATDPEYKKRGRKAILPLLL